MDFFASEAERDAHDEQLIAELLNPVNYTIMNVDDTKTNDNERSPSPMREPTPPKLPSNKYKHRPIESYFIRGERDMDYLEKIRWYAFGCDSLKSFEDWWNSEKHEFPAIYDQIMTHRNMQRMRTLAELDPPFYYTEFMVPDAISDNFYYDSSTIIFQLYMTCHPVYLECQHCNKMVKGTDEANKVECFLKHALYDCQKSFQFNGNAYTSGGFVNVCQSATKITDLKE